MEKMMEFQGRFGISDFENTFEIRINTGVRNSLRLLELD